MIDTTIEAVRWMMMMMMMMNAHPTRTLYLFELGGHLLQLGLVVLGELLQGSLLALLHLLQLAVVVLLHLHHLGLLLLELLVLQHQLLVVGRL